MARENSFNFFGVVDTVPIVLFNEESKTFRVTFSMKTIRRNGRQDFPKISIYSLTEEQAKEYVQLLKEGVWIQVRGMVSTKMVDKHIKCEACGHISPIGTLQTEIVTYGKPLILKEKLEPIQVAEFANVGNMMGVLCTEIQRKDGDNGPTAAQFQMAVNRRYRVNELEKATRTDFPWIKVFGETADECIKRAHKSSQIYLTGAFQTRDVQRRVMCNSCGGNLVYLERVGEVIPTGVEFLYNCNFVSKEEREGLQSGGDENEKK